MKPAQPGYVKLSRKLFQDPLWLEPRTFSRFEAWVDLIQTAQWSDRTYHTKQYGDITLKRGEFIGSARRLADRWGWSKSEVNRFLGQGQKQGRILGQRRGQYGTVYLVVNYDAYQSGDANPGTPTGTRSGTRNGTREKASNTQGNKGSDAVASNPAPTPALTTVSESSSNTEPPKTPAVKETASGGGSLDRLPKATADLCFTNWTAYIGVVNYPRLHKTLLACVDAGIPHDLLPEAVVVYSEWYDSLSDRDRQFNKPSPENFAVEARRWADLGKMPLSTFQGLTARGLMATAPRPRQGAA